MTSEVTSLTGGREILRFCNSYNRLSTLRRLWDDGGITNTDWLVLLGEEWSLCDDVSANKEWLIKRSPLRDAMYSPHLRRYLMTPKELLAYGKLRGMIPLWRGCYSNNRSGLSWSLDRSVAAKFPTLHRYRQDGQPLVIEAQAKRNDIIAMKVDRDEAELIAWQPRIVSTQALPTLPVA